MVVLNSILMQGGTERAAKRRIEGLGIFQEYAVFGCAVFDSVGDGFW